MVFAETSYTTGGRFLDMKERVTRRNDLKSRSVIACFVLRKFSQIGALQYERRVDDGFGRLGKVSQSTHMKSFS
ncbi:hypothetical protein BK668_09545 [Pseudomonas fluorescens]|nr:hypothetical protein BK668_09545 [Pseudomonas fluorescens]